jgi:predicted nuclease of predicted toxin-antitoxin system
MKVLLDQGTPVPLRHLLPGLAVTTAFEAGWDPLANGDLLNAAEANGFDVMVTTDQSLQHQQTIAGRPLAIVVLTSTSWPNMQSRLAEVAAAVGAARPGTVTIVTI